MQFDPASPLLDEPAADLRAMMADDCAWNQCVLAVICPEGYSVRYEQRKRYGRELAFLRQSQQSFSVFDIGKKIELIFRAIERMEGKRPQVGVLCVHPDGSRRFDYDLFDGDVLDITPEAIGTPYSYFQHDEVDLPENVRAARQEQSDQDRRFADCTVLELIFRDDELGNPCPERNIDLSSAIRAALGERGRIVDETCRGPNDALLWMWQIEVLDPAAAVAAIGKTLRELPMASSVRLAQSAPARVNYPLGLKDKPTLAREKAAYLVTQLVRESLRCAPPSWRDGVLTIDTDGRQINYKLKSRSSSKKAQQISAALRQLCEELCVVMWLNGQRWRVATLSFSRKNGEIDYKASYAYEEANAEEEAPRAWWKFWS